MKRFWKTVDVVEAEGGWSIQLDGRPVRTPAQSPLTLPTPSLAEAVASEWSAVEGSLNPREMPVTGLSNAAIDRVEPEREAFAGGLARYAEADLACYRSEWPPELVERQSKCWDPLLDWARRRFDVDFATTSGLIHIPQPPATVDRLAHAVAAIDSFHLAGLSPLVTVGGSLIAGLAVLERAMTLEQAWEAVSIDERWQLEQWGSDADAEHALENRRNDFFSAAKFLELLQN